MKNVRMLPFYVRVEKNFICIHMVNKNNKWSKEKCHEIALKYNSKKNFYINDINAYTASVRHKWLNEICSHMK